MRLLTTFLSPLLQLPYVGGQAVIEGVMMRSPARLVVAVRRPDGQIAVRQQEWEALFDWAEPLAWPGLRGGRVLVESLWNGMSALRFSVEQATPAETSGKDRAAMGTTLAVSVTLGLALLVGAPHLLTWAMGRWTGQPIEVSGVAFHAIDGLFKVAILLGYLFVIGRVSEIRRVFAYHGAEHKAIWAFEKGEPLGVESAARQTTLHPRCGTSFLILVLAISVALFAAVFPFVPKVSQDPFVNQLAMIGLKLLLMPSIAGIAYELQRLSAGTRVPWPIRLLVAPGLWLQRMTTREPDAAQLEIALVALAHAAAPGGTAPREGAVAVYSDFAEAIAA